MEQILRVWFHIDIPKTKLSGFNSPINNKHKQTIPMWLCKSLCKHYIDSAIKMINIRYLSGLFQVQGKISDKIRSCADTAYWPNSKKLSVSIFIDFLQWIESNPDKTKNKNMYRLKIYISSVWTFIYWCTHLSHILNHQWTRIYPIGPSKHWRWRRDILDSFVEDWTIESRLVHMFHNIYFNNIRHCTWQGRACINYRQN